MRKIIGGKAYDTETAQLICEVSSNVGRDDFSYYYFQLYRAARGAWFFWKSTFHDGTWLEATSLADACEFAEQHMTGEAYEAAFGAVEEA